jgi:hypothetical protein
MHKATILYFCHVPAALKIMYIMFISGLRSTWLDTQCAREFGNNVEYLKQRIRVEISSMSPAVPKIIKH